MAPSVGDALTAGKEIPDLLGISGFYDLGARGERFYLNPMGDMVFVK